MKVGYQHGAVVLGPRAGERFSFAGEPVEWRDWCPSVDQEGTATVLIETGGGHASIARLVPVVVCGHREYDARGGLRQATGCSPDSPGHTETSGRNADVIEAPPEGCQLGALTAPAACGVREQLRALGLDAEHYLVPDTVHGRWKRVCHRARIWTLGGPGLD